MMYNRGYPLFAGLTRQTDMRHYHFASFLTLLILLSTCTACDTASGSAVNPTHLPTRTRLAVASTVHVPASQATAALAVTSPRPTASPTPIQYTIQSGDTLFDIALKYGVTIASIVTINQITNPDLIRPGQTILIPAPSDPPVPLPTRTPIQPGALAGSGITSYTVESGDTLFDIALRFGVTIESIVNANNIADPEMIRPGQTLIIPESSAISALVTTRTPARPVVVATPPPLPTNAGVVNGIPASAFVIMSANVKQNIREVYRKGQTLGRNPRAFAKVGDSTIENGYFFAAFDRGNYKLGTYAHLQATINLYAGSFGRESVAVGVGYHTTTVMDPEQTNSRCQSGETLFECELRLTSPCVVLIRLGANDVGMPDIFERKLRQMVELALTKGIIPVLGTKADRQEGSANTINIIIRQIALGYKIPLWDFDVIAETMPNRGLASDNIHPTNGLVRDYTRAEVFQLGHEMQDLTALMTLDAIWREVTAR